MFAALSVSTPLMVMRIRCDAALTHFFPVFCTDVPFLEQLDSKAVHVIADCDESQDSCSSGMSRKIAN